MFEEFDGSAREGESALEIVAIAVRHLDECLEGRDVGMFGSFGDGTLVFVVIVVVVVRADVEEAIAFEVDILVNLEV